MNLFAEIGTHLSGIDQLRAMKEGGRLTGMEQTLGLRMIEVEDPGGDRRCARPAIL